MTTGETIALCTGIVSACTFGISISALVTTWRLWRLTNRPTVTVSVETVQSGNQGTALHLVVTNAGNRVATDIRLSVDETTLGRLLALGPEEPTSLAVRKCFEPESRIPVLAPGRSQEAAFGFLAVGRPSSTWREQARLLVGVAYRELETGRRFRHEVDVRIADSESFTGSRWSSKSD